MNVQVVLADTHPATIEGVRGLLVDFPMIEIAGEAKDLGGLCELLRSGVANVLVLDDRLPDVGGVSTRLEELLDKVRLMCPQLSIVLQADLDFPATVGRALAHGTSCILSKRDATMNLPPAILAAYAGGRYFSPEVIELVHCQHERARGSGRYCLSPRESEVLRLYMQGMTVTGIADRLKRSIKTVSSQKNAGLRKLCLGSECELYRFAEAGPPRYAS